MHIMYVLEYILIKQNLIKKWLEVVTTAFTTGNDTHFSRRHQIRPASEAALLDIV